MLSCQGPYVVRMRDGNEAVIPSASTMRLDRRAIKSVHFSNYSLLKEMVNAVPLQYSGDVQSNGLPPKPQMTNGEAKKSSSWWFGKANEERSSEAVSNPTVILPEVPEKPFARQLTRNEQKDCLIIGEQLLVFIRLNKKYCQFVITFVLLISL
ncbi:unnamed protein product [Strongylus vulgaris]|uniref:Uncharacterized protein n=1 Tax=Strongylus vulgaris TaxID=40348 RepID=A0A3P7IIV4_STRVU|nr:unnamed protein product [Strongylus vulgaris]